MAALRQMSASGEVGQDRVQAPGCLAMFAIVSIVTDVTRLQNVHNKTIANVLI